MRNSKICLSSGLIYTCILKPLLQKVYLYDGPVEKKKKENKLKFHVSRYLGEGKRERSDKGNQVRSRRDHF